MFMRMLQVLCVGMLVCANWTALAGEANPEMQDMRQQMQQIMQSMVEKGIDPQEFFGDVRQQMMDGTFDLAALQQKLVDKGIVDKETMEKMQATAQNAPLNAIRRQLEVSDEEWKALQPKIQRVLTASGEASSPGPAGQMGGGLAFLSRQMTKGEVSKRRADLQAATNNPAGAPGDIQTKLSALREATKKAQEELAAAQKDLIEVLTSRQEAVLALLGLL